MLEPTGPYINGRGAARCMRRRGDEVAAELGRCEAELRALGGFGWGPKQLVISAEVSAFLSAVKGALLLKFPLGGVAKEQETNDAAQYSWNLNLDGGFLVSILISADRPAEISMQISKKNDVIDTIAAATGSFITQRTATVLDTTPTGVTTNHVSLVYTIAPPTVRGAWSAELHACRRELRALTWVKNAVNNAVGAGGVPTHVYNFAAEIAELCRVSAYEDGTSAITTSDVKDGTPRWQIRTGGDLKFIITTTPTTVKVEIRSKFPPSVQDRAKALQDKGIISKEEKGRYTSFNTIEYTFADS